jgi:hypothetical protein
MKLIHPDMWEELKEDLKKRFGITEIREIKVGKIEVSKNTANIQRTINDLEKQNYDD